jgi:hypothetical protein
MINKLSAVFLALMIAVIAFSSFICNDAVSLKTTLFDEKATKNFTIKGIGLVATVKEITQAAFTAITATNANAITIMPYAFCSIEDPTVKYNNPRQWWGEKDEGVIGTIVLAKQNGLSIMLKPHLWLKRGAYTGNFVLPDEKSWLLFENSYRNYVLHYAKISDSLQVDMFCIGIELGAAVKQRPNYFSTLIADVKAIYKGKITYAANWDDFDKFPFWNRLDFIGIDAYFPLVNAANPTIAALQTAWKPHIAKMDALHKQVKKPIIFTEYGYRNTDSCTAEPWKENVRTTNNDAQAIAYEALFKSVTTKAWFMGGFVWKWYGDVYYRNAARPDYTPQLKPAEAVITKWYGK